MGDPLACEGEDLARLLESERLARLAAEATARRSERLEAVAASLSGARTPDQVAEAALSVGLAALGASRGMVVVLSPGGRDAAVLRSAGMGEAWLAWHADLSLDPSTPIGEVLATAAPVFTADPAALRSRYPRLGPMADRLPGPMAALPLEVGGRPAGVLSVSWDAGVRLGEDDQLLALAIATRCAEALDRAQLFAAERLARAEAVAARQRLAFLDELSRLLAEAPGEPEMVSGVLRLAVPTLGDWAGLWISADGGFALAGSAGSTGMGERVRALLEGDPELRLERARRGDLSVLEALPSLDGGSVALLPLHARREPLGVLAVASTDPLRGYRPEDLALFADVARRTALALDHARLYREARAAVLAQDEFIQVAAHELRSPIGSAQLQVQSLARILERSGAPEAEKARAAGRAVARLARTADLLLDVSRISAGRLALDCEEVDLAEVVREVVARAQDEAAAARCTVTFEAPGPVPGYFDRARMDQVATNLLGNALKYGAHRPVEVRVRAEADRLVLEVEDHGIGVAPADRERIFERFERAVSARTHAGLGLGLWIVRRIVEAHRGTVRVDGASGGGSVFRVELPADVGAAAAIDAR